MCLSQSATIIESHAAIPTNVENSYLIVMGNLKISPKEEKL
jgi:hypothetical protein